MNFENDDNLDYQLNKIASIVIKEKRLKKNYSLEELANKLNNIVTRQSLYRYENNEARMKNSIFKKICLALDENPNTVWNEINNRFLESIVTNSKIEDKQSINFGDIKVTISKNGKITDKDMLELNQYLIKEKMSNSNESKKDN